MYMLMYITTWNVDYCQTDIQLLMILPFCFVVQGIVVYLKTSTFIFLCSETRSSHSILHFVL